MTSVKWCQKQLGMSIETTVDWNSYMREVAVAAIDRQEAKMIGGIGEVVEVDESLFTKRKNHAGRILNPQWVFGGVCRSTKECFLVFVSWGVSSKKGAAAANFFADRSGRARCHSKELGKLSRISF